MIIVPDHWHRYYIVSIDPGNTTTGVAIYEIDYQTQRVISIEAMTLQSIRLVDHTELDPDQYSESLIKLHRLTDTLTEILLQYQPVEIVSESCFYHRVHPAAYGSLLTVINAYRTATIRHNPNVMFYTIEPIVIKRTIRVDSIKEKTDVAKAIMRIPEIMSVLVTPIEMLDEHAIDAIAIGYTHLTLINQT
jgi:Holliday junction resolvasome RuvABC endonuclease subunit